MDSVLAAAIIGIASAAIGSTITGLSLLVIDERRRKDERARWAKDDDRRHTELWLDRRRELYADIAGHGEALAMLANMVTAGYRLDTRDWFLRMETVFRVATEIRLVGGTRMSEPAGDLALAANALILAANGRRTDPQWVLRRLVGWPGRDGLDAELSAAFDRSLRSFVEAAEADLTGRPGP